MHPGKFSCIVQKGKQKIGKEWREKKRGKGREVEGRAKKEKQGRDQEDREEIIVH